MAQGAYQDRIKAWGAALKANPKAMMMVVIVLFVLDLGVVMRWQVTALGRMFAEARRLKSDIVFLRDDAKFSSKYGGRLETLRAEEAELKKKLISEEGLPQVLESVSKFADIAGMRILKIKPMEDKDLAGPKGSGFIKKKVSVIGKCDFFQLIRFVTQLENAPAFLNVQSIEIRSDEQEYNKQALTIILEVIARKA